MSKKKHVPVRWVGWGTFEAGGEIHAKTEDGKIGAGKDIRVIGGKVTPWKERKGHHLRPDMITGVFDKDVDTLVIGNGADGAIDCSDGIIESVKERGIGTVIIQRTPEACETYNALCRKGVRAALLAHATC